MMTATAWLLSAAWGLSACTEPAGDPLSSAADLARTTDAVPSVARPSCDQPLGGPALPATSTEAQPGFDEQLATLDLSQLPSYLALGTASDLNRAIIAYLLGKTYVQLGEGFDRDAALATGPLGKVVVGAFAVADPLGKKGADLPFLRRGLHRYYHCVRAYPLTLEGFRSTIWDYRTTPGQLITSIPKAGPRRLYGSPALGVYVAETLIGQQVHETEIQVATARTDGSHDFLSYDESGQQVRTSAFASGSGSLRVSSSPFACMTCHFDKASKSFSAVVPN